jgi:S-formylglutathione hydrolase FrmB
MVVVMPFGYAYPPAAKRPAIGSAPTSKRQPIGRTAIVGLSMGGGQALNVGLQHLGVFSRVANPSALSHGSANARYSPE